MSTYWECMKCLKKICSTRRWWKIINLVIGQVSVHIFGGTGRTFGKKCRSESGLSPSPPTGRILPFFGRAALIRYGGRGPGGPRGFTPIINAYVDELCWRWLRAWDESQHNACMYFKFFKQLNRIWYLMQFKNECFQSLGTFSGW